MAEGIQSGTQPVGTRVDRYIIDKAIERSDPFTLLYAAHDSESGDAVQLVELFPAEFVTREGTEVRPRSEDVRRFFTWGLRGFVDQATGLQRLEHPNIACVLRAFESNGTAYYAIAPEEGEPLSAIMARSKGGMTADLLLPLINTLVDALEQIHSAGLMHWDVRPDTLLVNDKNQPLFIDFGAARHIMRFKCRSLASAVPAGYAAPEVYSPAGQFGPWTDIYSLAAVAYHAISRGVPPEAQARQRGEMPLRPAAKAGIGRYPEAFLDAIDWGLRLDAAQRPQKLAEWREALAGRTKPPEAIGTPEYSEITRPVEKRAVAAAVAAAEQATTATETAEPAKRSPVVLYAIGGIAVAVIAAGLFFTQKPDKPADQISVSSSDTSTSSSNPAAQGVAEQPLPRSAPGSQSVALDRLANELMARQAAADAAVNSAREQAARAASAASAANSANADKAEKERLQKVAADAAAKEEAAKAEAAKVKAELDQRMKEAEAEQRKKDEAALAAQQAAAQQAQKQAPTPPVASQPAAPVAAPQQAAATPPSQASTTEATQQAATAAPATPPAAAPPGHRGSIITSLGGGVPASQQKSDTQAAAEATPAPAPSNRRGSIFPPLGGGSSGSPQKSDDQAALDTSSANVIATARKTCKTAAADVSADGGLTYDKAMQMPNARINSGSGTVTLPSVRMPDGRYAAVDITKDSCATVRGIRASP